MSRDMSGDKFVVVETRRRWSEEERRQAVEETRSSPVSSVARKHGIAKSLLFRWRKEAGLSGKRARVQTFLPVQITASPTASPSLALAAPAPPDTGTIEIELAGGIKLRVSGAVQPQVLKQVIAALRS